MNSSNDLRGALKRLMPQSIVARTSLSILVLAVTTGLLFSLMASWRMRTAEEARLIERVHELAATVESTASVACFLNDATLAKEIATGLLKNSVVAGVRISSGDRLLYGVGGEAGDTGGKHRRMHTITTPVHSPFDPATPLGRITLYVSHAEIEAQAARYSGYTIWMLGLQLSIVAAAVVFMVYLLVTRPIKGISDELHRLEIRSGMRLTVPGGRRNDEIGQLVMDVNALISRLSDVLNTERDLRMAQEFSERRMRLVFEKADTGILVLDEKGAVQSCNPAFVRILGSQAAEAGASLPALLAPHDALVAGIIAESRASGQPRDADLELEAKGRGKFWVELSVNPLGPNLMQALLNDITERKRAECAAHELASHDSATGVLNRRGIDAALARLLNSARIETRQLAVLLVDLDYFKAVNDTHGHAAGDLVLREVASILSACVRRTDLVGRLGGDEFIVLLPGVEGTEKAEAIAAAIIQGVGSPIHLGEGKMARIGASIGIAHTGRVRESAAELLRRADVALYAAKQAGRGRALLGQQPEDDPSATAAA